MPTDPPKWPKPSKRDTLRALQCCYYVFHKPVIQDHEFDALEKEYEAATGKVLPVGSDRKGDYTETEYALALYFGFRTHFKDTDTKPKPISEVEPPTTGGGRLYTDKSNTPTKKKQQQQQTTGFLRL